MVYFSFLLPVCRPPVERVVKVGAIARHKARGTTVRGAARIFPHCGIRSAATASSPRHEYRESLAASSRTTARVYIAAETRERFVFDFSVFFGFPLIKRCIVPAFSRLLPLATRFRGSKCDQCERVSLHMCKSCTCRVNFLLPFRVSDIITIIATARYVTHIDHACVLRNACTSPVNFTLPREDDGIKISLRRREFDRRQP